MRPEKNIHEGSIRAGEQNQNAAHDKRGDVNSGRLLRRRQKDIMVIPDERHDQRDDGQAQVLEPPDERGIERRINPFHEVQADQYESDKQISSVIEYDSGRHVRLIPVNGNPRMQSFRSLSCPSLYWRVIHQFEPSAPFSCSSKSLSKSLRFALPCQSLIAHAT